VKKQMMLIVDALKLVVKSPAVVLMNLVLTAVISAAAVYWLQVADAKVYQLVWSAVLGLIICISWWWLDAGSAAYFYRAFRGDMSVRASYQQGLWRALLFALIAAIWVALWFFIDGFYDTANNFASLIYSKLSAANRARLGYATMQKLFFWILYIAQWYLLPLILLPWITVLCGAPMAKASIKASLKSALRTYLQLGYWVGILLAVLIGVFVPLRLAQWRWGASLEGEIVSMIVRLSLAYVLFIFGWLLALAISASGSSPEMQTVADPTVPSPALSGKATA